LLIDEIRVDNNKIIRLVKGDITERRTNEKEEGDDNDNDIDVIVNAANSYLKHGGGVAGAIVRKGGREIQEESNKIGFVPVGSSVITTAGKLPFKAVIHTVGPQMGQGQEDKKLAKAVKSSLTLASDKKFKSVSMPAISSGIFGFPKDRCAQILVGEARRFMENQGQNSSLRIIEFCIIDQETIEYFKKEFTNVKDEAISTNNNSSSEARP
jgi:O-acetyl-ADP-ribose deacetylase (regulator of RNase III)